MTAAPLVSLVMPAWRPRREWLLDAVGSALGQRGCAVELIVVDDGSPEHVAAMLAHIQDDRLRVIRTDHGGEASGRNAGVALAAGDFIRHVDADDFFPPDSCARLVARNGGRKDVVAYGDHTALRRRAATRLADVRAHQRGRPRARAVLPLQRPHFSMLFPRPVIEAVGGWDDTLGLGTDWDYILRALQIAHVASDGSLATYYRRHPDSLTRRERGSSEQRGTEVLDRYFARHPDERATRKERRAAPPCTPLPHAYMPSGASRDWHCDRWRAPFASVPPRRWPRSSWPCAPWHRAGRLRHRRRRASGGSTTLDGTRPAPPPVD